ncbi:FAD-dependent oxidoreductase (plasmid) [Aliisedimentitalea scapharcae]|uniref:FAD-dependent oxidoreductase n=1 Tax=Aliisedimentitalea scapharcae TaxID=1524259 RepID=A0ABZ2XZN9_9RHOB
MKPDNTTKNYDVVVIGAGVQGLSSAFFLARNGKKKVAIVEQEKSYGLGSSSRSGSMIMKSRENRPKIELSLFSFSFFENFGKLFNQELEFRRTGFLSLIGEQHAARYEAEHELRRELGVPSRMISNSKIRTMCPAVSTEGLEFGVYCEDDGEVSAQQILDNYYNAAAEMGVDVYFDSEIASFETAGGQLLGLRTTRDNFRCDYIVNAAGAGAPDISAKLGFELPQSNLRRSIFFCRADNPKLYTGPMVEDAELEWYYRGLVDGRVLIGMGLEPENTVTVGPNLGFLPSVRLATKRRAPQLENFEVIDGHSGIRPLSPDIIPLIGPSQSYANFILNTGWGGEGIMHSPGGGAIVSDIIDGTRNYPFKTSAFLPKRFNI